MEEYENPWTFNGELFDPTGLEDHVGFVYLITSKLDGRKYIGQKKLWSHKYLVKKFKNGKKGRRRVVIESDWRKYYGSSQELKDLVVANGALNYKREVLKVCKTKGLMNYEELREQVLRDVLRDPTYLNGFVGGKIHRSHVIESDVGEP